MNCQELAARVQALQPEVAPRDVARLCLLLANSVDEFDRLEDDGTLSDTWQDIGMQLQAATDQHAAMAEELDGLARLNPKQFDASHTWTLIRAIKVQSQILQLYVGKP